MTGSDLGLAAARSGSEADGSRVQHRTLVGEFGGANVPAFVERDVQAVSRCSADDRRHVRRGVAVGVNLAPAVLDQAVVSPTQGVDLVHLALERHPRPHAALDDRVAVRVEVELGVLVERDLHVGQVLRGTRTAAADESQARERGDTEQGDRAGGHGNPPGECEMASINARSLLQGLKLELSAEQQWLKF